VPTSTSLSVRRFCRKYLPKVGEPAAGPLLALAAESLDPFRPGDGLFGSFGGVVSPLARTILDEKMVFEIKDGYAYSEAGRYGKEVMDDVVFLVGATSYDQLVRFCEYQWGAARISGRENAPDRNWPHADYFAPWTHQTVNETLAKNEQRWGETVVRWTSGRTLLLDEASDDPVVCELARRVREGGEEGLSKLRENLLVQYARNFHGLSAEHRVALYQNLRAVVHTFGPKLKPYFDRTIEDYRRKYPDEAEQAARAANTPVAPAASAVDATATPAPGSGPANAGGSPTVDHAGPGGERALLSVRRLAFEARLPRLHAAISLTLDEDLRDDDRPESGGSAEDERILAELHQTILAHRAIRPGTDTSARPRWGEDRTYVPDQVLENAPFAAELADLLARMIAPGRGFMLAAAGATLLSREGLRRFGEAWSVQARPAEQLYEDHANHILDPLAERQLAPIALLHAVFTLEGQEFPLELTEGWQRAIAALYIRGGDAGRAAALDLLARYPYPKEVNEYCNRRDFYDAHQSTMWTAWERRDAEMLGLAFERFAIPYFWKGSKALLSKREPFFMRSGYAARSDTGEGAPLTEVWKLAASAGRTAATAKMAIRHAELCEAPRTLLDLAAPEDLDGLGDDVLVLPRVIQRGGARDRARDPGQHAGDREGSRGRGGHAGGSRARIDPERRGEGGCCGARRAWQCPHGCSPAGVFGPGRRSVARGCAGLAGDPQEHEEPARQAAEGCAGTHRGAVQERSVEVREAREASAGGVTMEAVVTYHGASGLDRDVVHLAPNLRRDRTRLHARIVDPLAFRDALLALHDVVRSELYVSAEDIEKRLDPLITVTPEGVFFEALSLDESSYGRIALRPGALEGLRDTSYGCTNIDFSPTLVSGLRQIRSGQATHLEVAREGMVLEHGERQDREEKIELPDSWMRGFLEVQAALRLPAQTLSLAPIDLGNVLAYLKGRKEKESPRGLVFELGRSSQVTVQPWNKTFPLRKSRYEGPPATVKVWGRRRLLLLDKVLARTQGDPGAAARHRWSVVLDVRPGEHLVPARDERVVGARVDEHRLLPPVRPTGCERGCDRANPHRARGTPGPVTGRSRRPQSALPAGARDVRPRNRSLVCATRLHGEPAGSGSHDGAGAGGRADCESRAGAIDR
jgi:hypothetical protein